MPARNIKTYIAAVAAAAAVGLGAPAAASAGFIAAPVSALASGPGGDASQAPTQDLQLSQQTPRDDPHTYWDDGAQWPSCARPPSSTG